MPGLCTPSIVFTFIAHYWFFHQNTLNSDALLDPCYKTGYLTCETCYKSMRTLVVETPVWNPWSRHNFLSPNPSPKRNSSAPFEIRTFPGRGRAVWNRVVSERIFVPPFPAFFLASSSPLSDTAQWTAQRHTHSRQIVPSIQFQVLLTLFSQFFSTFLRSTSPLSVSMSYLGLEEIYLPFYALFPKYATRKQKEIRETQGPATGLSPSLAPISIGLCKPCVPTSLLLKRCIGVLDYTSTPFSFDLFRLRSPLLAESRLISFPGVNNMLKFTP